LGKSTYEKEMMAIIHVVHTWRPYLLGRNFHIKTDHHSLKYFIEQRLSSPKQNKWLTKMMGYDYEIIYKKGKYNLVAYALSRQYEDEGSLFSLSLPIPHWIDEVQHEWITHPTISHIIQQLQADTIPPTDYTWKANVLKYKDRLVLSLDSTLKPRILNELHSFSLVGHSGFQKTYARARHSFFLGRYEEGYSHLCH
jgi:hypothetical protein